MPLPPGWRRLQLAPFVLGFSLVPRTPPGEGLEYRSYPTTCTVLASRTVPSSSSCVVTLIGCVGSSKPCCHSASALKARCEGGNGSVMETAPVVNHIRVRTRQIARRALLDSREQPNDHPELRVHRFSGVNEQCVFEIPMGKTDRPLKR